MFFACSKEFGVWRVRYDPYSSHQLLGTIKDLLLHSLHAPTVSRYFSIVERQTVLIPSTDPVTRRLFRVASTLSRSCVYGFFRLPMV